MLTVAKTHRAEVPKTISSSEGLTRISAWQTISEMLRGSLCLTHGRNVQMSIEILRNLLMRYLYLKLTPREN